jgi:hypothetical protein
MPAVYFENYKKSINLGSKMQIYWMPQHVWRKVKLNEYGLYSSSANSWRIYIESFRPFKYIRRTKVSSYHSTWFLKDRMVTQKRRTSAIHCGWKENLFDEKKNIKKSFIPPLFWVHLTVKPHYGHRRTSLTRKLRFKSKNDLNTRNFNNCKRMHFQQTPRYPIS